MQIRTAFLVLSAALISGCGGKHVTTVTAPEIEQYSIEPVLLVPFRTPVGGSGSFRNREIKAGSPESLTTRLREKLLGMTVEIKRFTGGLEEFATREASAETLSSEAVRLGREYGVPTVLFGTLSAYVERIGSSAGVQRPASVGFSLVLIETEKGLTLWEGRFDETQKALFDDLFEIRSFWNRRGRWVETDELAEFGLNELLRDSPWFQRSEKSGESDENLPGN